MSCRSETQERKDLITLNQKLLTGKNPKLCLKRKHKYEKSGWKTYDGEKDKVRNHLISENMIRKDNKNLLDFTRKAVNPSVYPNVRDVSIPGVKNDETLKSTDEVLKNIDRDAVLETYQAEKQEALIPSLEIKKDGGSLFSPAKQKYMITQVRNYLPLVKNTTVRDKLLLLLKYLHNTSAAKELTINEKGNVLKGLFDTQTKFSEYLSYYVLPAEEKRSTKKPPFYYVLIEGPLNEYSESVKQRNTNDALHPQTDTQKHSSLEKVKEEEEEEEERIDRGTDTTPLRAIKDSDLRLELSLRKTINILTSLNINMVGDFDSTDYENMIKIIAFPVYAGSSKDRKNSAKKEYLKFCEMLEKYLNEEILQEE
jgi:hypothetical protein